MNSVSIPELGIYDHMNTGTDLASLSDMNSWLNVPLKVG